MGGARALPPPLRRRHALAQAHHTLAVDQYGFNSALMKWRFSGRKATFSSGSLANTTAATREASLLGTVGRLKQTNNPRCTRSRRERCRQGLYFKCHGSACIRVGLLPAHYLPREGSWEEARDHAFIFHGPLVGGHRGSTGEQEKKMATMRVAGLWRVPPDEGRVLHSEMKQRARAGRDRVCPPVPVEARVLLVNRFMREGVGAST